MASPGATQYGHAHAEAFMLMRYRCENCGRDEIVWNSRDGVTSFLIDCRWCTGCAHHVAWYQDVYVPDFHAPPGMRVFVDLTRARARELAQRNARRFWDHPGYPARDRYESIEEFTRVLARDYLAVGPGNPDLIVVEEDGRG